MRSSRCAFCFAIASLLCLALPARGTEYFVSPRGNDTHDGRSRAAAFRTVQAGVDALEAGDTLTLAPGEYFESVARENLGSDAAATTIRAEIPGTAVLRGDVPAPTFTKVPGTRFVYACSLDETQWGSPQAVFEHDTLQMLAWTADPAELEFSPGRFTFDAASNRLLISTSDMIPPANRPLSIAVNPRSGLYLKHPRRVVIDGLAATGFFSHTLPPNDTAPYVWQTPWGIALDKPVDCIVRNVTTWFNAGGIGLGEGRHNLVEHCLAFANGSKYQEVSGNIGIMGRTGQEAHGNLIRDCIAYGGYMGIHYYGRMSGPNVIRRAIAWDNTGGNLKIKTGLSEDNRRYGLIERSVALGWAGAVTTRHNLARELEHSAGNTDIILANESNLDLASQFADPMNLDFRLQADSRFRGAAEDGTDRGPHAYRANVFYVRPDGDDAAAGTSIAAAWRTLSRAVRDLEPGDTLYLDPGVYSHPLTLAGIGLSDDPIALRGRGREPVILRGAVTLQDVAGIALERLTFTEPLTLDRSRNVTLSNCVLGSAENEVRASAITGLTISHNLFAAAPLRLEACSPVILRGNAFGRAGAPAVIVDDPASLRYADYNSYADTRATWSLASQIAPLASLRPSFEQHAQIIVPRIEPGPDGEPRLSNAAAFAGRGPNGTSLGVSHRHQPEQAQPVRVVGPVIHSVTDTTANLEWFSSGPTGPCHLAWRDAAGREQKTSIHASRYGAFSLTGLTPDASYEVTLTLDEPVQFAGYDGTTRTATSATVQFRTASAPQPGTTRYVAPHGDNTATGQSRDDAWRTLSHAASHACPGDTILVAGGRYHESVRIRTTGTPDQPITFKAMPGEKVILDGDGRTLNQAFYISGKSHLRFDGFYFTGYGDMANYELPWSDWAPGNGDSGAIALYLTRDIHVTRCFLDGRGAGYAGSLVIAREAADTLIRNCVMAATMPGGVRMIHCPGTRLEHSVLLRNNIYATVIQGRPGQHAVMRQNIITDNLPVKVKAPLLYNSGGVAYYDNCIFPRIPPEQRQWGSSTLSEWVAGLAADASLNPPQRQIIANPLFAGAADLQPDAQGNVPYAADVLMAQPDLDFPDLFATSPQLVELGIGLQPQAFADFHFNRPAP